MDAVIPCCEMMQADLERECEIHSDRAACPDALIAQLPDGRFGLSIHDGGSSAIVIAFCPWCGTPLPGVPPTRPYAGPSS